MLIKKLRAAPLFAISLAGLLVTAGNASAAVWPDHLAQAQTYVSQIKAANNAFNSPATLAYDASQTLQAQTKCSSFVNLLLKNTYPGFVTDQVLVALTGSSSPYADEWFTAIRNRVSDAQSKLALKSRATVSQMRAGDLIASSYTTSGNTGHVMVLASMDLADANIAPPYPIPDVVTVNRYLVKVYDSTNSPHGNYFSNTNPDSRYDKEWNGTNWVADQGLGSGFITLYEDVVTGKPVAWAWNTSKTTKAFYYAVTPPAGNTLDYRPLAIGYLAGL
ncbi:exported hypothetical protein [Candidatus Competibacter denitrificans Run_A_D11]|uniref:Amidase domain-containing protein n=1 Tax=Candidatus Competibacter denitrificans Run_A_D11 TaxID=1400863 RepID=W6M814_9GAMM|nr:hypothetical protein [Candidatus Competibacter denitrificans]CDI02784.1 exported hypothetical protein [Candidatus Competibacter denitrificans Run_A_D11]HRC69447.1 hypothetical protein [Candidatus Competibacter denitrificans]